MRREWQEKRQEEARRGRQEFELLESPREPLREPAEQKDTVRFAGQKTPFSEV